MAAFSYRSRLLSGLYGRIGFLLVVVLLLVGLQPLLAGPPKLHKNDGRHQIDQLEDAWRTALLKADVATMSGLLADDYMGITGNGTLQTKEQMLDALRSGQMHLTVLNISDRKVRFYGKTAVVTARAYIQATSTNGDLNGQYRSTRVYVKDTQGQWKIVSFEASKIFKQK